MKDTDKYEAAFALSEVDFTIYDSDGKAIFTPEDHYNCRLFIHERHKGA